MNSKRFSEAMNELDTKYIDEAILYKGKNMQKKSLWMKSGTVAACICLMLAGSIVLTQNGNHSIPHPAPVQIPNPFIDVTTIEEMEQYLDFDVPVLDKEIHSYSVLVVDSYPTMGQIHYTDGSKFRIQYGSGDISGIYGGTFKEGKEIGGIEVQYYQYADITYAIWEQNGFTCSYIYTNDSSTEVKTIIQQIQ